jgi:hypothetical protein
MRYFKGRRASRKKYDLVALAARDRKIPAEIFDQAFPLAVLAFSHAPDLRAIQSLISASD